MRLGLTSGKFIRTVSSRILLLVLLLQTGHDIQLSFLAFTGSCTLFSYSHLKNLTAIPVQIAVTATIITIGNPIFSIGKSRKIDFIS